MHEHRAFFSPEQLQLFLDFTAEKYETPAFIAFDPIQIPHRFSRKEDIEISAFLVSTIAWGQRPSIIKSANRLMELMEHAPHQYILDFKDQDLSFVHRTFNSVDLLFFLRSLQHIYRHLGSLESVFIEHPTIEGIKGRLVSFRTHFLTTEHQKRSEKHISNPLNQAACKRLNMFLRWMVRSPNKGVDFGLWKNIHSRELVLPLDAHSSRNARQLGLLTRKQNDWRTVEEIMVHLRRWSPEDPVKYDFALFGLGALKKEDFLHF